MKVETVTEHMLFSTLRLEADKLTGTESGTGFIFSYRIGDNDNLFIVTNKHVINNSTSVRFFLAQGTGTRPLLGQKHDIVIDPLQTPWCGHPDPSIDVAILPFQAILQTLHAAGQTPFFRLEASPIRQSPSKTRSRTLIHWSRLSSLAIPMVYMILLI